MSLSDDKQADIIDTFNTIFRYLDDISNINNVYFDYMVSQIYHSELQLGVLLLYLLCYALLGGHSSFAIILKRERKMVALLLLSYRCIVTKCSLALPHSTLGWSAVCDCSIT